LKLNVQACLGKRRLKVYLFIYLFIHSNGGYVEIVIHPFSPLPPSIFGMQLSTNLNISKNDALSSLVVDHNVCRKDEEIMVCDKDASQDNNVQ
jgi:hypothetical protein